LKVKKLLTVIALAGLALPAQAHKKEADPSVAAVGTIYVDGDSEVSTAVRRKLIAIAEKEENGACFQVAGNPDKADAVLKIGQNETTGGFWGNGRTTTVATGNLTNKDGDLIWSDSKQGANGLIHTGAGSAAENVLHSLWQSAGCDGQGRKR
jgi:hypothetical protein